MNPLLEITIQQRSQDSGRESLQLPDNLLPSALHSCLWRDNSPVSCWAQLQVSGEGERGGCPVLGELWQGRGAQSPRISAAEPTQPPPKRRRWGRTQTFTLLMTRGKCLHLAGRVLQSGAPFPHKLEL